MSPPRERPGAGKGAEGPARRLRRRGGFALIMVLFLVMLLSVAVGSLVVRTSGAYRLSRSRAVSCRLYYSAAAAIEETKARLWHEWISDEDEPGIFSAPGPATSNQGGVQVTITFEDEAGKFPVNDFAAATKTRQKELVLALARLFDELDLPNSTSLATSVRDYIDKDSEGLRESGAKNAEIFDISELAAVRGFDVRTLFMPMSEKLPPAAGCLSTWYSGKVNLNSASAVVLKALEPSLTDDEVEEIIAAREEQAFASAADISTRADVSAEAAAGLAAKTVLVTDTLTLKVEAREGPFVRRIEAVVWIEQEGAHTLYIRDGWQS